MPQCAVMAGGECWCWDPDLCYVPDWSGECLIGGYILLFCSLFPLSYNLDSSLPSSCALMPLKGRCTDRGAVPLPLLWTFSFHIFFCTFSSHLSLSSFSRLPPPFPISSFSSSTLNLSYWRCSAVSEPPASPLWAFPLVGQRFPSLLYVWK